MKTNYPKFHIYGPKGWINDPNGLIYYKGEYHVFYQYYPNDVHWGPMHWGHAISKDLRHWQYLEPALKPDSQDDGCFSGSAIEIDGRIYLFYTSFTNRDGVIRQQQALAISDDGIHFEKKGLIITSDELPEGYAKEDFRDPSVIKDGDEYLMYTAGKKVDGRGRVLIFKSKDMCHWSFCKDLFEKDCIGTMIECPDRIGNIFTFSEQFFPTNIDGNNNIHASRYIIADKNGNFDFTKASALDYGFDFYAAQTFKDQNILIGWMDMWDRSNNSEILGYAGELTYPRVLTIVGNELKQTPYLNKDDVFEKMHLESKNNFKCKSGIMHLVVEDLTKLKIYFNKSKSMHASLVLDENLLIFDRSKTMPVTFKETDENSLKMIRKMPFDGKEKTHEFYFVIDNHSVEMFADGKVLSSLIDTDDEEGNISIDIEAGKKEIEILKI